MYKLYQGSGGDININSFGKCIRGLFKNVGVIRKRFKGEKDYVFRLKEKVANSDIKCDYPCNISRIPEWLPSTYTICRKDSEEIHAAFFGGVVNEYPTVNKIIFNCNGVWQLVVGGKEVNLEELLIDPHFVCSSTSVKNICEIVANIKYCTGIERENRNPDYTVIGNHMVEYLGLAKCLTFRSCKCRKVVSYFAITTSCRNCQNDVRFIKPGDNASDQHFSKDDSLSTNTEKGKAHHETEIEECELISTVKLTMKGILLDKSERKKFSHLKLQGGVIKGKEYLLKSNFLKRDLQKLCEAYDIVWSKHATVKDLNCTLVSAILQCDAMPTPDVLIEGIETTECSSLSGDTTECPLSLSATTVCPPSSSKTSISTLSVTTPDMPQKVSGKQGRCKYKGKRLSTTSVGKSKKKTKTEHPGISEESKDSCHICLDKCDLSNWIQCDGCDKWVHGECADIKTPEQWEKFETEHFLCPFCQ